MEFNQYNLYSMSGNGNNNMLKQDEVDTYITEIRNLDEYDEIKSYISEKFGTFSGEKWVEYPENNKFLYLMVEPDKIEVCALKNKQQYFGKGWKLVFKEEEKI